ncbi:MAG: RidA family protein [Alphaproteobacteria bacterium]|nr:RidA family protein [Alphaproteobacteria bacterium]MCW5750736.1 RidA family protein [Alphaproteobacteria bacterium]
MAAPEKFNPKGVAAPIGAYSHVARIVAGSEVLHISGQVGMAPDGKVPKTVGEQAEVVFANILAILKDCGMSAANIAKLTTFVVQGQPAADVRAARAKALGEEKPASTLVFISALAAPEYLVEVEVVACK